MSVKQTLINKIAAEDFAVAVDYASKVACEFVKQASGVEELTEEDTQKIAESLYTPVVLASMAKLSGIR
jgi:hypothetical protein